MQEIWNIVKAKGEDIDIEDVYDDLIDLMNILSVRNLSLLNLI